MQKRKKNLSRLTIDEIVSIRKDEVIFKVNGDNLLYLLSLAEIEECKWDEKVLDLTFNYELKKGVNIVGEVHKIKGANYDCYVTDIDFPWEVN